MSSAKRRPRATAEKARASAWVTWTSRRYDLVITHFGWRSGEPSNCERLLHAMRQEDLRAPVVVFASSAERAENRAAVLELGALAYTDRWEELFQTLEDLLLDSGDRSG